MHINQSSYSRWSWIVALLLALLLLWMLLTGRGTSVGCCGVVAPAEVAAPAAAIAPAVVPEAFSFSATCNELTSNGDSTNVSWFAQADALKASLCADLKVEGNDKNVVLTGVVDSDAIKQQKGADAQALFGPSVAVDNQLTVKVAEPVAVVAPPPAAKLYFDTGKTNVKQAEDLKLEPIITYLKANPSAKAVIAGFHDPRGKASVNEALAEGRATRVTEALKAAGIEEGRIEMRKPADINGGSDLQEARRVEVSVE